MILLTILLFFQIDRVLVIGDSLSTYTRGWQEKVSEAQEFQLTNLAVGGKRTHWMLSTTKNHLKNDHNYKQIYIYGGINDMFAYINIDTAVANIQKIVDIANQYGIKPVVIVGYDAKNVIKNTWIKDKTVEMICVDRYVEYQSKLLLIKNAKIIPIIPMEYEDTNDGIHPNASGFKKITNWILQNL